MCVLVNGGVKSPDIQRLEAAKKEAAVSCWVLGARLRFRCKGVPRSLFLQSLPSLKWEGKEWLLNPCYAGFSKEGRNGMARQPLPFWGAQRGKAKNGSGQGMARKKR
eukprot:CAMPEP_0174385912 /NCGR_PEP_ID=MMETSP0811_2-20130205/126924_1 /TAXON_ID=73025 ORGANISM="Eutreptiella gymnastica-like, Strain CCMP1594" /NCGR_SAMPLE_ID=MMETSP0811_2 /ASSEMBLY_ACC=CAM_ASM_000667 /LENGTH=106 /DNA_ID=CAMNT_0015540405 /DNA_START=1768 /DNA_END=2088 /DNA_ORIENTATION=-